MSTTTRDPNHLADLEQKAKALRDAKEKGLPAPVISATPKPEDENETQKQIRKLEKALGKTSTLDCKHADLQQFTECCMNCWINVYTSDSEHLKSLEREFDRRVAALEAELGINQIEYW